MASDSEGLRQVIKLLLLPVRTGSKMASDSEGLRRLTGRFSGDGLPGPVENGFRFGRVTTQRA